MRVVITGGAGFIGSNLAHHWCARHPSDEVVVFDLLTYAGREESIRDLVGYPGFRLVRGDVADPAAATGALRGADLVLHLAAETHNDRAIADARPFLRTNIIGTSVLLEVCRRLDVPRFHHVSTDEVFGMLGVDDARRFTEDSPYRPRGPYSASKASADHLVRAWFETYGLPVTLSNCGNNFGPYQFPEKLIPLAVTRLLSGGKVPVYGDGRQVRDWIFVDDHCEALELIATRGKLGSTYLVSSECERSNLEVVEALCRHLNAPPSAIEHVADRPGHDRRYALDPTRLKSELGWRPRVAFEDGLARTVAWYQEHPDWWGPLVGPTKI